MAAKFKGRAKLSLKLRKEFGGNDDKCSSFDSFKHHFTNRPRHWEAHRHTLDLLVQAAVKPQQVGKAMIQKTDRRMDRGVSHPKCE